VEEKETVKINKLFFLFFLINNIYSIDDGIMDLENIYYEIVLHKYLWDDTLDRFNIDINYEDILKMERRERFVGIVGRNIINYSYQGMSIIQNIAIKDEYTLIVPISSFEEFRIRLKHMDGKFVYQSYNLRFFSF